MTDEQADDSSEDRVTNPVAVAGLVLAVIAFALGVVSFAVSILVGVPAVACSALGFRLYRLGRGGRFPAAAGLVIGSAAVILSLAMIFAL